MSERRPIDQSFSKLGAPVGLLTDFGAPIVRGRRRRRA
jgi:hypothetical protein